MVVNIPHNLQTYWVIVYILYFPKEPKKCLRRLILKKKCLQWKTTLQRGKDWQGWKIVINQDRTNWFPLARKQSWAMILRKKTRNKQGKQTNKKEKKFLHLHSEVCTCIISYRHVGFHNVFPHALPHSGTKARYAGIMSLPPFLGSLYLP